MLSPCSHLANLPVFDNFGSVYIIRICIAHANHVASIRMTAQLNRDVIDSQLANDFFFFQFPAQHIAQLDRQVVPVIGLVLVILLPVGRIGIKQIPRIIAIDC